MKPVGIAFTLTTSELLDFEISWDFLMTLSENDIFKYYKLDNLKIIHTERAQGGIVQKSYGMILVQETNRLLSYFVMVGLDRVAHVVQNELLFVDKNIDLINPVMG